MSAIRVSCRAVLGISKAIDAQDGAAAIKLTKQRLEAAAIQVASDLMDEGFAVDLDVGHFIAYGDEEEAG